MSATTTTTDLLGGAMSAPSVGAASSSLLEGDSLAVGSFGGGMRIFAGHEYVRSGSGGFYGVLSVDEQSAIQSSIAGLAVGGTFGVFGERWLAHVIRLPDQAGRLSVRATVPMLPLLSPGSGYSADKNGWQVFVGGSLADREHPAGIDAPIECARWISQQFLRLSQLFDAAGKVAAAARQWVEAQQACIRAVDSGGCSDAEVDALESASGRLAAAEFAVTQESSDHAVEARLRRFVDETPEGQFVELREFYPESNSGGGATFWISADGFHFATEVDRLTEILTGELCVPGESVELRAFRLEEKWDGTHREIADCFLFSLRTDAEGVVHEQTEETA